MVLVRRLRNEVLCWLRTILVVMGVAVPSFTFSVCAQEGDELSRLDQKVGELFKVSKYAEASTVAKQYADLAEEKYGSDNPLYANALSWQAAINQELGQYKNAEKIFKRILAIDEAALGKDHVDVGRDCNNLALLYQDQGRFPEAEKLYKRALTLTETALGPNHFKVSTRLHNLASLHWEQGRYTLAEPLLKRSLSIRENKLGKGDGKVGRTLGILGRLYSDMGRFAEAEAHHRRALSIRENIFGPNHMRTAFSLNDLATLYQRVGQTKDAEILILRALTIRKEHLGPEHPKTAQSLYVLGGIQEQLDKPDKAEPLYKRALAIQESVLGLEHPDVATTRASLGGLYKSQGRLKLAQTFLESALKTRENALDPNHPAIAANLLQLSELYRLQGRRDDSEEMFRRARKIRKSGLREVRVYFATNRKKIGNVDNIRYSAKEVAQSLEFGVATLSMLKEQDSAGSSHARLRHGSAGGGITDLNRVTIPLITSHGDSGNLIGAAQRQLNFARTFKGHAFIFVHGFNVSFESAVRRAGQIAYDVDFDGPVFVFSWASRESIFRYFSDRDAVSVGSEDLEIFLKQVVAKVGADKVHIIAHSMGNMIVLNALSDLGTWPSEERPSIGEILDAAPDVAPIVFSRFASKIGKAGGKLTVYASSADKALWLSQWLWGRSRVGFVSDEGPTLVRGVDTIDITNAGMAIFATNHDVYASNPFIVSDIRRLFAGDRPPHIRTKEFQRVASENGDYWYFRSLHPTSEEACSVMSPGSCKWADIISFWPMSN